MSVTLPKELVFATGNAGKVAEVQSYFEPLGIRVRSLKELGVDIEVVEDRDSFAGNAEKKAREIFEHLGVNGNPLAVLADDSGLCVDALGGDPGIYSARYAGVSGGSKDAANNAKLLKELAGAGSRAAHFACALALVLPEQTEAVHTYGRCEGTILEGAGRGAGGFGYDPIFVPAGENRTMAELSKAEKLAISHRGDALRKLIAKLSH